jgi:hypothetical protein
MFNSHRITTLAAAAIVTTGLGLGAFMSAATAAAAPVDDQFLSDISSTGIAFDSPAVAISQAHNICDTLSAGQSLMSLGRQLHQTTDWTPKQAATFTIASVNAYCPENHDKLAPPA